LWTTALLMGGGYAGALLATAFVAMTAPGITRLAGIPTRWRDALDGIGRGAIGIAVLYPLAWATGWIMVWVAHLVAGPEAIDPLTHETLREIAESPSNAAWWSVVALVVIGAPMVEEIVYRGFLQPGIAALTGRPWIAIIGTSVVFAGVHLGTVEWHAIPVLFLLSLGLGVARHRTGSVATSITMHAAFNAVNIALVGIGM